MPIPTIPFDTQQALYDSIETLERMAQEANMEREQMIWEALEACVKAGVEEKYLRILARETGLTSAIKHLLEVSRGT